MSNHGHPSQVSVYNALSIKDRQILGLPTRIENLAPNLPVLSNLMRDIEDLAVSGARYDDAPEMIDVVLPLICSYIPTWIEHGPKAKVSKYYISSQENQDKIKLNKNILDK